MSLLTQSLTCGMCVEQCSQQCWNFSGVPSLSLSFPHSAGKSIKLFRALASARNHFVHLPSIPAAGSGLEFVSVTGCDTANESRPNRFVTNECAETMLRLYHHNIHAIFQQMVMISFIGS